ncbi:MAG: ASCH domain-containing protein [Anaeromyxobacter sp.]
METLTMNIERQYFAAIVAGTKRIEYRELKPYWARRIEPLTTPFRLRLLNGMTPPVPEAVVLVTRVTRHARAGEYRLHLGRVLSVRRWDRRAGKPR